MALQTMEQTGKILLCVGGKKVQAKRDVLKEKSGYFHALFSGQFADSQKDSLDLTKDVNDIKDIKLFLQFINDENQEITGQNLTLLVQLSTFFTVDKLIEKCEEFMNKTLNISNCLGYYFLARKHGLRNVETGTSLLIQSRMHDLLIYEKEIAQLTEDEIDHLLEKKYFKHCTKEGVVKFLLNWLDNVSVLTDTHLNLVSKTIESFSEKIENFRKYPTEDDSSKARKGLKDILDKHADLGKEVRDKFENVLQLFAEEDASSTASEQSDGSEEDKTVAIFTFSHRKFVKRDSSERQTRSSSKSKQKEKYFDICVYNPSTKWWYHIETCEMDTYYSRIKHKESIRSFVIIFPPHIYCTLNVADDFVLLQDNEFDQKRMVTYNMRSKKWSSANILFHLEDLVELVPDAMILGKCMFYWNNSTYIIIKLYEDVVDDLDEFVYGIVLRGFHIFESQYGNLKFSEIFKTDLIPCNLGAFPNMIKSLGTVAGVSSVSNELLILDNTLSDLDIAYVVDLTPLKDRSDVGGGALDVKCILDREHEYDYDSISEDSDDKNDYDSIFEYIDLEFLEKEDRLLVVNSGGREGLEVKFEYRYHSLKLDTVGNGLAIPLTKETAENGNQSWEFSCRCALKDSMSWIMLESGEYSSYLKKVTVQESITETVTEIHTPPPFKNIISLSAKEVGKDFFSNLRPIEHFLEPPAGKAVQKEKHKARKDGTTV